MKNPNRVSPRTEPTEQKEVVTSDSSEIEPVRNEVSRNTSGILGSHDPRKGEQPRTRVKFRYPYIPIPESMASPKRIRRGIASKDRRVDDPGSGGRVWCN